MRFQQHPLFHLYFLIAGATWHPRSALSSTVSPLEPTRCLSQTTTSAWACTISACDLEGPCPPSPSMTSTVEHPPPEPSQPSQPPSTAPSQPSAEPSEPPPGIPLTPMAAPSPSSAEPLTQPITPTSSLEGNLDDPIQVPSIPIDGGESLSPVTTALDKSEPKPSEGIVTSKVTVAVLPHTTLVGAVTLAEARVASETLSNPESVSESRIPSLVGSAPIHQRSDTITLLLWAVSFSVALVLFRV